MESGWAAFGESNPMETRESVLQTWESKWKEMARGSGLLNLDNCVEALVVPVTSRSHQSLAVVLTPFHERPRLLLFDPCTGTHHRIACQPLRHLLACMHAEIECRDSGMRAVIGAVYDASLEKFSEGACRTPTATPAIAC